MEKPPVERLVVIGAGGFGREVLDVIDAINHRGYRRLQVLGVVADPAPDDDARELLEMRGAFYIGGLERTLQNLDRDVQYVIGIGSSAVRRAIDKRCTEVGREPVQALIHPSATTGTCNWIEPGVVVCSHVSITNNVTLGRHVHLNLNSTVGHDARLGDYVTVSPLVGISGRVHAKAGAFLGTGAAVREGVSLGEDATVGMGAVVVKDVAPGVTVVGNPAREVSHDRHVSVE